MSRGPRITTILVLIVLSVTAVGLALFLGRCQRAMEQNARISAEQTVSQAAGVLDNYIRDIGQGAERLTRALERGEDDAFFLTFLCSRPDMVAAVSYDAEGNVLRCWSVGRVPRKSALQNLSFDPARLEDGQEHTLSDLHVESIFEGYYPWVVTFTQRLEGEGEAKWLALVLRFSRISELIDRVSIGRHGYCYIMDTDGQIVYHPQQLLHDGLKEEPAGLAGLEDGSYVERNLVRAIHTVPSCDWRIVGVSCRDEIVTARTFDMLCIALWVGLVVLLATVACGMALFQVLLRPLHSLSSAMRDFEQDADGYVYQPIRGPAELRELSDAFGHMVLRIQGLMARVREEEINLRKAELKALEAQINPHFLYNTLDSIAWMCEQGRSSDAVQMVNALGTLFRISTSGARELIPISRELEHAKSYLEIQKHRYKDQLAYTFEVEPDCLDCYCNKITLQPILENAITHGLGPAVDDGRIEVKVYRDGEDVVFLVADNGVGMEQAKADALLDREPGQGGIGLKNVNDRLRIYFGEGYGLKITSEPDKGTRVAIRMPRLVREEYREK